MIIETFATVVAVATTLLTVAGLGYYLVALWSARSFLRRRRFPAGFMPAVSILKPLHGLDEGMLEAFASHCRQNYSGDYELLFGVSQLDDPAAAVVQQLQAEFPERSIRLIQTPEALGPNGKVSNLAQLVTHARFEFLIFNDSDIHVGPDYLAQVMAPFAAGNGTKPVGMVTALYRGRAHETLGSRLEALGISTDFAPGVLTSRWLEGGIHFGMGSTLAVSRTALEAAGGLAPLAEYLADDYELGARIARAGYSVELCDEVVETFVPAWSFSGYLQHQLRWARAMRDSRRGGYAGLTFSYGLAWSLVNLVAWGIGLPAFALFSFALMFRVALALGAGVAILGDRQVVGDLWLLPLRDLLALGVWAWSYASDGVVWRDERFVLKNGKLTERRMLARKS